MANGHGGARAGSGRKPLPKYLDDGQLTPLQLLLTTMRDPTAPLSVRLDLAVKAAPYCHARLLATDLSLDTSDLIINLVSYADARADPAKPNAEGLPAASVAGNGAGGA